jgi:predicted secreted protein
MKKLNICLILTLTLTFSAFAGDAAVFKEIGFSEDGSIFIFGQYGKTDVNYQAWAEIYTVDVEKNEFVKNEVYKSAPSKESAFISGKKAFENLLENTEWKLSKYKASLEGQNLLYVCEDEKKSASDEIVFKDYEASSDSQEIYWHVKLVPYVEGNGKNCRSSFFINLEKKDAQGNTLLKTTAGTPSYKRKGITAYRISSIFTDKSSKNMVIVVEKTLEDDKGTSVRYMVETLKF